MAHQSENTNRLKVNLQTSNLVLTTTVVANVEFIILPHFNNLLEISNKQLYYDEINNFIEQTNENTTIAIITSSIFAADFCTQLNDKSYLKLWISVALENSTQIDDYIVKKNAALLIITRYKGSLNHTKTRIGYTYCPTCHKTTKDYGGKKHLYHEYGTLMSDVWQDITIDFNTYPDAVINRLQDLFGITPYQYLNIYDLRNNFTTIKYIPTYLDTTNFITNTLPNSLLLNGDCIEELRKLPDNSIDFCFADPPYNIKKKYENWNDGIDIQTYFDWCDTWLTELARVVKPNCTVAILNIPQWCIRHFKHLNTILDYQDWIVWEGLSLPVRMIMPAHYSILCFSKGKPRPLPALQRLEHSIVEKKAIQTLKQNYCVRPSCVKIRHIQKINDTQLVTNVWRDIHRLKHNSRRVDHPCQLPPNFMYRLISLFTNENEFVLDPFNGVGTTTLAAEQLNRKFIGIELSDYYHNITANRHKELEEGIDPFRKNTETPKTKNSRVERLTKQVYEVSKKQLQLEIRQITQKLERKPTKEEVATLSQYPIEYYENYFTSWGEVMAAARTTGMTEYKNDEIKKKEQLALFEERKSKYKKKK